MKIKLDECVDSRLAIILRQAGHETATVQEQGLRGMDDKGLYNLCAKESQSSYGSVFGTEKQSLRPKNAYF